MPVLPRVAAVRRIKKEWSEKEHVVIVDFDDVDSDIVHRSFQDGNFRSEDMRQIPCVGPLGRPRWVRSPREVTCLVCLGAAS